jgi:hypothetical protein
MPPTPSARPTKTSRPRPAGCTPLHSDHPENDPSALIDDCVAIGPDLGCPATGAAVNSIRSCVVEFPFGIDAALMMNSKLRDEPDVSACTVLLEAFDKVS